MGARRISCCEGAGTLGTVVVRRIGVGCVKRRRVGGGEVGVARRGEGPEVLKIIIELNFPGVDKYLHRAAVNMELRACCL